MTMSFHHRILVSVLKFQDFRNLNSICNTVKHSDAHGIAPIT